MQYRAIGLVQGIYTPTEEQFNHGNVTTEDGATIDSVLLGRVTSLVKKHIDLTRPHLWVVYPRTRRGDDDSEIEQDLHLQIVGVWEPETLGLPGEDPAKTAQEQLESPDLVEAIEADPAETTASVPTSIAEPVMAEPEEQVGSPLAELPPVADNYFSIRGEVVKYAEDEELIMVKILQGAKRPGNTRKAFRLVIRGNLAGRTVGHFWDFDVKREGTVLVMSNANLVGIVPPKKKGKSRRPSGGRPRGSGGPSRRPGGNIPRPQKPVRPERGEGRPQHARTSGPEATTQDSSSQPT